MMMTAVMLLRAGAGIAFPLVTWHIVTRGVMPIIVNMGMTRISRGRDTHRVSVNMLFTKITCTNTQTAVAMHTHRGVQDNCGKNKMFGEQVKHVQPSEKGI